VLIVFNCVGAVCCCIGFYCLVVCCSCFVHMFVVLFCAHLFSFVVWLLGGFSFLCRSLLYCVAHTSVSPCFISSIMCIVVCLFPFVVNHVRILLFIILCWLLCVVLVVAIGLFLFIITTVDILFPFVCCVHVLAVVFVLLPWWCAHFLVFIFVLVWQVCCGISLGAFVFILVARVGFRGFGFCGDFRGSVFLR
jgi:hypothetical protein